MYLCWEFGKTNNHAVPPLLGSYRRREGIMWNESGKHSSYVSYASLFKLHLNCTYDIEYMLEVSSRIKSLLFKEKSSFGFLGGVARARFSDRHRLHAFIHNLLLRPPVTSRPHVARSLQTFSATPAKCQRTAGDSHRSHSIPTGDP